MSTTGNNSIPAEPTQDDNAKKDELNRAPLGPDSLLWRLGSDMRIQLCRTNSGLLQNMYPAIGQSLLDHSKFFEEPFARLQRSTPQVIESIYSGSEDNLPERIRNYHVDISGKLKDGQRYHALNPDTYWWAHATFVYRVILVQDLFGTPLTEAERDQVVREGVTWWEKYGVSNRPVIDSYKDLMAYFDDVAENTLERNATVDYVVRTARNEPVKAPDSVPPFVWKLIWKPLQRSMVWLALGTLEPRFREILEVSWTEKDQKRFSRIQKFVRKVYPHLPLKLRYMEPGFSKMKEANMFDAQGQLKPVGSDYSAS